MFRELSTAESYNRTMAFFSFMTLLLGVASLIASVVFIPFAAAFLACLFIFEKPKTRFLSYLIPLASIVISIPFAGWSALFGMLYVTMALIISICYVKKIGKAECSVYLSFAVILGILTVLTVILAKAVGGLDFSRMLEYLSVALDRLKLEITDAIFSLGTQGASTAALPTEEEIELLLDTYVMLFPALIGIVSFLFSGIALKVFVACTRKNCKHGVLKGFASFVPSSFIAYFFAALVVICIFIEAEDIVSIALLNLYNVFLFVFSYMGLKYLHAFALASGRRALVYGGIVFALLFLTSSAFTLLSLFGIYVTVVVNFGANLPPEAGKDN